MRPEDHEFYSLSDAAENAAVAQLEILKMGGLGKAELRVFFSGHLQITYAKKVGLEYDPYEETQYPVRDKLLALRKDDLLRLYQGAVRDGLDKASMSINYFGGVEFDDFAIDEHVDSASLRQEHEDAEGVSNGIQQVGFDCRPGEGSCELIIGCGDLYIMSDNLARLRGGKHGREYHPCLDPRHDYYATELKIVTEAWLDLYEKNPPKRPPKGGHLRYIGDWLTVNYPAMGPTARKRLSTVINPNHGGGSSRS